MIFYDFESMIIDGNHVVNYVVAETVCTLCQNEEDEECEVCGPPVIFSGASTLDEFGAWLFNKDHKSCVALAHNMKVNFNIYFQQFIWIIILHRFE